MPAVSSSACCRRVAIRLIPPVYASSPSYCHSSVSFFCPLGASPYTVGRPLCRSPSFARLFCLPVFHDLSTCFGPPPPFLLAVVFVLLVVTSPPLSLWGFFVGLLGLFARSLALCLASLSVLGLLFSVMLAAVVAVLLASPLGRCHPFLGFLLACTAFPCVLASSPCSCALFRLGYFGCLPLWLRSLDLGLRSMCFLFVYVLAFSFPAWLLAVGGRAQSAARH